jgi:hypothetical protein
VNNLLKIKSKSSMKIIFGITIAIGFLLFIPQFTTSHFPYPMSINYNLQTETLTVSFNHPVNDNTTHYIYQVEIFINDVLNSTKNYSSQPTLNEFNYTYNIITALGDVIKVNAYCNFGGDDTKTLTVGETPTDTVPASFVCMTILGLLTVGGIIRRKKS